MHAYEDVGAPQKDKLLSEPHARSIYNLRGGEERRAEKGGGEERREGGGEERKEGSESVRRTEEDVEVRRREKNTMTE